MKYHASTKALYGCLIGVISHQISTVPVLKQHEPSQRQREGVARESRTSLLRRRARPCFTRRMLHARTALLALKNTEAKICITAPGMKAP